MSKVQEPSISKDSGPTLRCQLMGEFGAAAIQGLTQRIEKMEGEKSRIKIGLGEFLAVCRETVPPGNFNRRFEIVFKMQAEQDSWQMRWNEAELNRRDRRLGL